MEGNVQMEKNELVRMCYVLREKRCALEREGREIKKIEDKLIEQVKDAMFGGFELSTENYIASVKKIGIFPSWKTVVEKALGEAYIEKVIDETPPTYGIEIKRRMDATMREKIEDAFPDILAQAKRMVG
jgi:hypothetical protein